MFLILLLCSTHLVFGTTNTASSERLGWTSAPNFRGTTDIIWSSLCTIFLCVWTVLHLNVPTSGTPRWKTNLRKIKWMGIGALGPEFVTAFAGAQWSYARRGTKKIKDLDPNWTNTHSFFADMGGVRLRLLDHEFPIVSTHIFCLLRDQHIQPLEITTAMIDDRTKADVFAKTFTMCQTLWFIVQCIARLIQGLSITSLEVTTIAFVVCTIGTYALWWSKPKGVFVPVVIRKELTLADIVGTEKALTWQYSPLDAYDDLRPSLLADVFSVLPGYIHIDKSRQTQKRRLRNDRLPPEDRDMLLNIILFCISLSYASVYLAGWNLSYPSALEQLLWHISTSLVTAMVLAFFILDIGMAAWYAVVRKKDAPAVGATRVGICILIAICYIIARAYLLVEAFVSLRSVPASSYETVHWTKFIPHL
jgi:hypothetical protein